MKNPNKINWINTLFLILMPIIGIAGTALLCVFHQVHWATWVLTGAFTIITGLSITAGYHRMMAHKSYTSPWPVRLFFLLFGAAAFEGSALEWATDHRNHHRFEDTEKDPYNINKGFWYAHIGWLIRLDTTKRDFSNVADLQKDPLMRFQHRFFTLIAVAFSFVLPAAIAALWGDAISGLVIAGALRLTFNHHATFAINSFCHKIGKQNYTLEKTAVDSWITALFTYGEGYHNFHHKFPLDYRNGIRAYHFDPTKWLINALHWMGLAHNLKKISHHRIIRQQLQVKEQILQQKLAAKQKSSTHDQWIQVFNSVRQGTQQLLQKIESLEIHYVNLIKEKTASATRSTDLKAYRKKLKESYSELKNYLALWQHLHRQCATA